MHTSIKKWGIGIGIGVSYIVCVAAESCFKFEPQVVAPEVVAILLWSHPLDSRSPLMSTMQYFLLMWIAQ